jgi:signal transduction histidine kinase
VAFPRRTRIVSRQALFFLLAIVAPCSLLIVLTVRMLVQDAELAEKRASDERRRLAADIGQELVARLNRVRAEPPSDAVALVATAHGDRLVLPWDNDPSVAAAARALNDPAFRDALAAGEHDEFVASRFVAAAEAYRAAAKTAASPAQAAFAQLQMARAFTRSGQPDAAQRTYEGLVRVSVDVVDDQGLPIAMYAARALLGNRASADTMRDAVHGLIALTLQKRSTPPAAVYLARDLAAALMDRTLEALVSARIRDCEQAIELQKRFPRLPLNAGHAGGQNALWMPFGPSTSLWLVASTGPPDAATVIAARVEPLFRSLPSAAGVPSARLSTDRDGDSLGPAFANLTLVVPREAARARLREGGLERPVYLAVLVLVMSAAGFGAYLFARDVRRELRMAEVRSQFVSSVSHELKTPLTAIRMFAETLLLGRSPRPEVSHEYLETIVNESERLTRLLNNVLDFSKIEQGTKQYRLEPQPLAAIMQSAARAMEYPLAQQGFELRVDVVDDLPPVAADADAIQQALLNLLSNAMKYSGEGRVIDLALTRDGGDAVVSVIDRGIGISATELPRIFDQFYRVQSSETQRIAGTGLGLTLVDHVARAHGGTVAVRSAPGAGSTFTLRLPLLQNTKASDSGMPAPAVTGPSVS